MKPYSYRCRIALIPEENGFSAIVLNLRGCASCGDTREEALQNVKEAIIGVIKSYIESNENIPWNDSLDSEYPDTLWIEIKI